jgi:hypothetical protein
MIVEGGQEVVEDGAMHLKEMNLLGEASDVIVLSAARSVQNFFHNLLAGGLQISEALTKIVLLIIATLITRGDRLISCGETHRVDPWEIFARNNLAGRVSE